MPPSPTSVAARHVAAKGISIGRSSSNPGYLSVTIPDEEALDDLARVFPDMGKSKWLRDAAKQPGGTADSLGFWLAKESEDHWVGGVWWEDKHQQATWGLRRIFRFRDEGSVYEIEVEVFPRNSTAPRKEYKFEVPFARGLRVDPKAVVMRTLQTYFRSL
jgi:hypothetical protein